MEEVDVKQLTSDYENSQNQLKFVAAVLSAKTENNESSQCLKNFSDLLDVDFAKFASDEHTYTKDAWALSELKRLEQILKSVSTFPMLYTKNIISVAGGFSSGKSKFLNTFFQNCDVQLSIGIKPVTAIPTYIVSDKISKVVAFTNDGRRAEIPTDIFAKIDHNMIDSLGFNLKNIMPYVTVATNFKGNLAEQLQNVCFIDTPGYDPSGDNAEEDSAIAFDAIRDSSAIIWAINVKDGTIHEKSIGFINKIKEADPNKKIYVVCTKADLAKSQIQKVMTEVRDKLEENGIEIDGISAYASKEVRNANDKKLIDSFVGEEYMFEENETSVFDFVKNQNSVLVNINKRCTEVNDKIDEVFNDYKECIEKDLAKLKEQRAKEKELRLRIEQYKDKMERQLEDARSSSGGNYYSRYKSGSRSNNTNVEEFDFDVDFSAFWKDYSNQDERNLKKAEEIRNAMKKTVNDFFKQLVPADTFRCPHCNAAIDPDTTFCPHCGEKIIKESKLKSQFCPECGTENDGDALFCNNCGTPLNK